MNYQLSFNHLSLQSVKPQALIISIKCIKTGRERCNAGKENRKNAFFTHLLPERISGIRRSGCIVSFFSKKEEKEEVLMFN